MTSSLCTIFVHFLIIWFPSLLSFYPVTFHFILYIQQQRDFFIRSTVQLGSNVYRKDIIFSSFSNSKHIIMSLTVSTNSMCKMDYEYSEHRIERNVEHINDKFNCYQESERSLQLYHRISYFLPAQQFNMNCNIRIK